MATSKLKLQEHHSKETIAGIFGVPSAVAVDASGNVFVADINTGVLDRNYVWRLTP